MCGFVYFDILQIYSDFEFLQGTEFCSPSSIFCNEILVFSGNHRIPIPPDPDHYMHKIFIFIPPDRILPAACLACLPGDCSGVGNPIRILANIYNMHIIYTYCAISRFLSSVRKPETSGNRFCGASALLRFFRRCLCKALLYRFGDRLEGHAVRGLDQYGVSFLQTVRKIGN